MKVNFVLHCLQIKSCAGKDKEQFLRLQISQLAKNALLVSQQLYLLFISFLRK